MSPRRPGLALAVALTMLMTASCGLSRQHVFPDCERNTEQACSDLGGYPVGRMIRDCGDRSDACTLTRRALDAGFPDHPLVARAEEYELDMNRVCDPGVLCTFSGGRSIVIFAFADGSHRALGYLCPGVSPCRATFGYLDYGGGFPSESGDK